MCSLLLHDTGIWHYGFLFSFCNVCVCVLLLLLLLLLFLICYCFCPFPPPPPPPPLIWYRYFRRNGRRYQHVLALCVLLTVVILKELTLQKFVSDVYSSVSVFCVCVGYRFCEVTWERVYIIWESLKCVFALMAEFGCPGVTLCGWQDDKIRSMSLLKQNWPNLDLGATDMISVLHHWAQLPWHYIFKYSPSLEMVWMFWLLHAPYLAAHCTHTHRLLWLCEPWHMVFLISWTHETTTGITSGEQQTKTQAQQ